MASVTCTPNPANVGQFVTVEALDFLPSTLATMTVQSPQGRGGIFASDTPTDSSGEVASTDIANYAVATLTSSGVDVTANDTVTIGANTYTFKAAVAATANEVKVGGTAAATLQNLKDAINLTGTTAQYGSATVVHPTVRATTITATTLFLVAKTGGTGGNGLAFSKVAVTLTVSGATFSGGAAVTTTNPFRFTPTLPGVWAVTVSDGTTSVTANLQVFTST